MFRALFPVAVAIYLAGLVDNTSWGQPGGKSNSAASGIAQQIVNDPERYQTDWQRLRPLVGNERVVEALITAAKETAVAKQETLVDIITAIASPLPDPTAPAIPRCRLVKSERAIDFLVGLLKSPHVRLRSKAASILTTRGSQKEIQARASQVLAAIARPSSNDEYLLLGETRNREAMARLPKPSDVEEVLLPARRLAAAMLGDSAAEQHIIDHFRKTDSPEQRNELAMALARIGSTKTLAVLAQALRSPYLAKWGGTGKQSFRLVVIASLSWAYHDEQLLWEPRTPPTSDRYYEAIENWAVKQFGIRWDMPRPPFLYQEYAPMFPRGR